MISASAVMLAIFCLIFKQNACFVGVEGFEPPDFYCVILGVQPFAHCLMRLTSLVCLFYMILFHFCHFSTS